MTVAIDVDSAGNGPLMVGTTDTCNETMTTAGDTLIIDVIIDELDPGDRILAWSWNLGYDPSVVEIIDVNRDQIIKAAPNSGAGGGFIEIGAENPTPDSPDTDGQLVELIADFGFGFPVDTIHESGAGVLARITLRATGTGVSTLSIVGTVQNPISIVAAPAPGTQLVTDTTIIGNAQVAVGQACTAPPPVTPTPRPGQDSDGDGLSDTDEQRLGTDPNNPDTDGDGLTDGQEVNVLATNPLVADADSDIPNGPPDTGSAPPGGNLVTPSGQLTGEEATQQEDGGGGGLATAAWIAIGLGAGGVLAAVGLGGWLARRRRNSP